MLPNGDRSKFQEPDELTTLTPEQAPLIGILVLNWNNPQDTIRCLRSIENSNYSNYQVLVIDNGSQDDSVAKLRTAFPELEILETGQNLGYSGGNNVGISYAIEQGVDYVMILNNDTLVAPSMLDKLVSAAEKFPQAGLVGPLMYRLESQSNLFAAGSFIDWEKGKTWHRIMFQPASNILESLETQTVDFIAGCCMLISRTAIEKVGLLSPSYYLNYEDVDFALKIKTAGFSVLFVPEAIMWHKISATLDKLPLVNIYYITRNSLYFFNKYAPGLNKYIAVSNIILRNMRTILAWSLLPRYIQQDKTNDKLAILLGMRDFFLGRSGIMGKDVAKICYMR